MAYLNLFGLFVQGLFGTVLMATIFIIAVFWLYGGFMKMGILLMTLVSVLYMVAILPVWYGGAVGVLIFIACSIYFVISILPFFGTMWER